MKKSTALAELKKRIGNDKSLPLQPANLVFGEGDAEAKVVFIGEAPGKLEDELIRPFVGRSGQLLRKSIIEMGWKEEDVYITNIVKRRPPDNRDPLPEEIEAYRPYLKEQLQIIDPAVIVPLGRFSMNYFLPEAKITRDQGKVFKLGGKIIMPVFHPAAALRATGTMELFKASLKNLPAVIKKYG